jgi:phage replication O-like protein O
MKTNIQSERNQYGFKIYQPNTTQIPNVILDYWMGILPSAELKCLLAISRKTFGWQKKKDKITKRQIGQASGMSNDAVRKAIRELEKRGLILSKENPRKFGKNDPNTYEINVIVLNQTQEKCQEELDINPLGRDFDAQWGVNSIPRWGAKSRPSKQNITKPTITKGNAPNPQIETKTSGFEAQALDKALPYSSENKLQTHQFAKPLTEDQAAIVGWLAFQNIPYSTIETFNLWAVLYPAKLFLQTTTSNKTENLQKSLLITKNGDR